MNEPLNNAQSLAFSCNASGFKNDQKKAMFTGWRFPIRRDFPSLCDVTHGPSLNITSRISSSTDFPRGYQLLY